MQVTPSEIALLLAMSLFFGLAYEEFGAQDIPNRPGAVPTFPLLALAGAARSRPEPPSTPSSPPAHCLHRRPRSPRNLDLCILSIAGERGNIRMGPHPRANLSFRSANILAYTLGALALTQPAWALVAVTVIATLLLAGRRELHRIAARVSIEEVFSVGKFLLRRMQLPAISLFALAAVGWASNRFRIRRRILFGNEARSRSFVTNEQRSNRAEGRPKAGTCLTPTNS